MSPRKRRTGPAFTVEFPRPLPAERDGEAWWMEAGDQRLRLSNLDKVFWPDEGYTKGDLLAYYYNVADLILPYLSGRPLTMKRMPDGITGPHFYEKNAPSHTPDWMPRCWVPNFEGGRYEASKESNEFLLAEDVAGLLFVVNLGAIEFHPLHSRCGQIDFPDYLFFDLDPFEPATFADVLAVAHHVRVVLDQLGLEGYPKTSGATGMQIHVPVEPRFTYDEVRDLVGAVGHVIRRADPDRVTMQWEVRRRAGKVFVDHNMNRIGANIAAVYSLRPEPGATVSTPLTWDEVAAGEVRAQDFRIDNAFERFREVGDLFRGVIDHPQDVTSALEALGVQRSADRPSTPTERRGPTPSDRAIARSKDPKLGQYLEKRTFGGEGTPEPPPDESTAARGTGSGREFVIQKHRATRLHYDVRLERDGVMVSWAVPKGLPTKRGDRHLAVQTEDHPIEYNRFEGTIPSGHYGAGEVRIFDKGTYDLVEWTDRKVSFVLHGERYQSVEYHFVKLSGKSADSRDWLAILAKDQPAIDPDRVAEATGALSPPSFSPMLAEGGHKPFDDEGWRFEPKLDGIRTLAYVENNETRLYSRTGRDQTSSYPELSTIHEYVTALTAVLDGEIVAYDENGVPRFERLQQRMNLLAPSEIERMRRKVPVRLAAFDVLWLDGEDLTALPLEDRRRRLETVVVEGEARPGRIDVVFYADGTGKEFAEAAERHGLEGVVAKRLGSRYHPGRRTSDWRKIKLLNRQDCVVLGWTPGKSARSSTFGALLVGAYDRPEGTLRWIGQVGSGFTDRMLADLMDRLRDLTRDPPPIDDPDLAKVKGARFVEPRLVCEVEFLEITSAGKLRAPSYKGLRLDKPPEDCVLERPATTAESANGPGEARPVRARPRGRSRTSG